MTLCNETISAFDAPFGLDLAKACAFYGLDRLQERHTAILMRDMIEYGAIHPNYIKLLSKSLKSLDAIHLCTDIQDLYGAIRMIACAWDAENRLQTAKPVRMTGPDRGNVISMPPPMPKVKKNWFWPVDGDDTIM